jgi:hypothetical protein
VAGQGHQVLMKKLAEDGASSWCGRAQADGRLPSEGLWSDVVGNGQRRAGRGGYVVSGDAGLGGSPSPKPLG